MDMRIFLSLERLEFRDTITFFHPEVKLGTKIRFSAGPVAVSSFIMGGENAILFGGEDNVDDS